MSNKMVSYGWTNASKWYQTLATSSKFTGTGAPVTQYDLCYFNGHGDWAGPYLGGGAGYAYDGSGNRVMSPYTNNYRWADTNLKWMVIHACETLADGYRTGTSVNWWSGQLRLQRWMGMFNKNGNYRSNSSATNGYYWLPDGSLHVICGARSQLYIAWNSPGNDFADRCLRASSTSVGQSWMDAVVTQDYLNYPGKPGIEPAVLSVKQTTSGYDWFTESLKSPTINPGQCDPSTLNYYYRATRYGSPEFSNWNCIGSSPCL